MSLALRGWFSMQKALAMKQLNCGERDRSIVGAVDRGIADVVAAINVHPAYFTTSSCSGRMVMFHRTERSPHNPLGSLANDDEGPSEIHDDSCELPPFEGSNNIVGSSARSDKNSVLPTRRLKRGSGEGTIWSSHEPTINPSARRALASQLARSLTLASLPGGGSASAPPNLSAKQNNEGLLLPLRSTRFATGMVDLRFEPAILHVRCCTLQDASALLAAATSAGFRNAGMIAPPVKLDTRRRTWGCAASRPDAVPAAQEGTDSSCAGDGKDARHHRGGAIAPQQHAVESFSVRSSQDVALAAAGEPHDVSDGSTPAMVDNKFELSHSFLCRLLSPLTFSVPLVENGFSVFPDPPRERSCEGDDPDDLHLNAAAAALAVERWLEIGDTYFAKNEQTKGRFITAFRSCEK